MAFSYDNYTGNGTTTQFSITFTYQDTSEISVTVDGVAETGLTFPSASTVQLTSAPAVGTLVQVRRTTDLSARAVDFASGSVLTEEDLDDSNIQVFHAAQESVDLAADSIQLDNDNKWDAQNSVIKNVGTPTASTDAATKGYTDTEVAGVVSSAVSQATTAAVSAANTAVATATGNIIPDATKLAIHPIGTQYTLSDGVTTDYSSKHYANVASTNATTATNAASAASTDAGTASTAATAAQVAQAAAEAALDTFDDRFLGAKASDPSVDNDGNTLLDGAIYFNTTDDIMKVYDATNTVWHDLALTGTDQTNVNLVAGQISPTNNIATVAGISADITTTATNNADITTVATSIADVNAVATDIANVNTVATNLSSVNAFADTYFISATAPASPTLGDLWFDTTNDIMKVYSASGFVNAGSSVNGTANRYVYTATSGQTTFAATYDAGYIDVYLNGVKLQSGTDFTATDGANVVLTVGAALNDQIDIVGYGTFNIAIPDISGDATPQLGGNLDTNGNDITFGDNDKAIFGAGSDLQIYHSGADSYIVDAGTGDLYIRASNELRVQDGNQSNFLYAVEGGDLRLYHNGSEKFRTTATGVDVTGGLINIADSGETKINVTSSGTGKGTRFFLNNQNGQDLEIICAGDTSGVNNMGIASNSQTGVGASYAMSGNTFAVGTYAAYPLVLGTNNAERLLIDSSGNVGIGTSSTNYGKFTVQNTAGTGKVLLDSYQSVPTTENVMAIYADASNGYIESYNNGYKNIIIAGSGGNVGIGTSSPAELLHIDNASGDAAVRIDGSTRSFKIEQNNYGLRFVDVSAASAERMRITASGKVGIGQTSPDSESLLDLGSGENSGYTRKLLVTNTGNSRAGLGALSNIFRVFYADDQAVQFGTVSRDGNFTFIEKMRLDSSGNLLVGGTSLTQDDHAHFEPNGVLTIRRASGNGRSGIAFFNGSTNCGNIILNTSSTQYNTSSDYRLKTAVTYDWDATTRLKQLRPARFEWIADGDDAVPVDGFLAHEVQTVVPEAISGTHNGMRDEEYQVSAATGDIYTPAIEAVLDEDDNEVTPAVAEVIHSTDVERPEELAEGQQWRETTPAVMGTRSVPDYQGIDQSKLVPLLVKTIQELEARIAALENV